jgi:hypothetical protein
MKLRLGSLLKAGRLDGTGGGSGYKPGLLPSEWRLAAIRRLPKVLHQPDRPTTRLLEAVIVEDLRWCELGKRRRVHPRTAKRYAVAALRQLAQVWRLKSTLASASREKVWVKARERFGLVFPRGRA